METMPISQFKARCLAVLARVKRTGEPVLVTRFGEPIAEVVPPSPPPRPQGCPLTREVAVESWRSRCGTAIRRTGSSPPRRRSTTSTMRSSEGTTMGKRRKRTPEERAAELERRRDLDRRLREMIERYRALNAAKRASQEPQ